MGSSALNSLIASQIGATIPSSSASLVQSQQSYGVPTIDQMFGTQAIPTSLLSNNPYGATGSSGAGRFLTGAPIDNWMANMQQQTNYVPTYKPSPYVIPAEAPVSKYVAPTMIMGRDSSPTGNMSLVNGGYGWGTNLGK